MLKCGIHFAYNYLYINSVCTIICIYILYEFCIQIVYIIFMMHTFCRSELMYKKCVPNVYKMYPTFLQTFIYILYTKFSCNSSFNFVYKMHTKFVEVWDTFHIHLQSSTNCARIDKCAHNMHQRGFCVHKIKSIKTLLSSTWMFFEVTSFFVSKSK